MSVNNYYYPLLQKDNSIESDKQTQKIDHIHIQAVTKSIADLIISTKLSLNLPTREENLKKLQTTVTKISGNLQNKIEQEKNKGTLSKILRIIPNLFMRLTQNYSSKQDYYEKALQYYKNYEIYLQPEHSAQDFIEQVIQNKDDYLFNSLKNWPQLSEEAKKKLIKYYGNDIGDIISKKDEKIMSALVENPQMISVEDKRELVKHYIDANNFPHACKLLKTKDLEEVVLNYLVQGSEQGIVNVELFELLIEKVDMKVIDAYQPFRKILSNKRMTNEDAIKRILNKLIDCGADPTKYKKIMHDVIHKLRDADILEKLCENEELKKTINAKNSLGVTLIHDLARTDKIDMIQVLIDNGADVNVQDKLGYTPLHLAILTKNYPTIQKLVEQGAEVEINHEIAGKPLDTVQHQIDRLIENINYLNNLKASEINSNKYPALYKEEEIKEKIKSNQADLAVYGEIKQYLQNSLENK